MPEPTSKKDKTVQSPVRAGQTGAQGQSLAPPAFQLKADPVVQRDEDPSAPSPATASVPNYQLQLPGLLGGNAGGVGSGLNLGLPQLQLGGPQVGPAQVAGAPQTGPVADGSETSPDLSPTEQPQFLQDDETVRNLRERLPLIGGLLPESALLSIWQVDPLTSTYEGQNGEDVNLWSQLSDEQIQEQMDIMRIMRERHPTQQGMDWGLNGQGVGGTYNYDDGDSTTFGVMPSTHDDTGDPIVRFGLDHRF